MEQDTAVPRSGRQPVTTLVIATLNRPEDLARCLRSVARVTPGFDEVILVEQGDLGRTEQVVRPFRHLDIRVLPLGVRSLTRARNLALKRSRGDYVFFVDDDTELPPGYVAAALAAFAAHPEAVGLTGTMRVPVPGRPRTSPLARWGVLVRAGVRRLAYTALLVHSVRRNRVLRSGSNSTAKGAAARAGHEVEWLQGCHCVYRRRVFDDGFRFHPDFIRWSFGEDVMLSWQVFRHYGRGSLRFVPDFTLTHYAQAERSLSPDAVVRMMVLYRFLFWRWEVYRGSWFNLLCYLWGQPGFVIFHPLASLRAKRRLRILRTVCRSYWFLVKHRRDIAANRVDYNGFILHGTVPPPEEAAGACHAGVARRED